MRQPTPDDFVIVGIGASAGGLEPLEKFFSQMPPDSGIGFAVVQHLAPDHESALSQLLARCTSMPVEQAETTRRSRPTVCILFPLMQR